MKILYGVVSEGMGHATRSKVVITYLLSRGHVVLVASAGRAARFLTDAGFDVIEADGLTLKYADGAVDIAGTAAQNLAAFSRVIETGFAAWSDFDQFAPDVVFSDFDSLCSMYGRTHGIPVISIDNMQVIDRCLHAPEITSGYESDFKLARTIVANRLPGCRAYIVTTFFYPPCSARDTTLVPPILREAVLGTRSSNDGSVLVYQTQSSDTRLLDVLGAFPEQRFNVYGIRTASIVPANVRLKPFSEDGFVADLAASSAVLANGGMSLLGEALYFGKPVYSVPVRNHAEQSINARYIAALGYGVTSQSFNTQTLAGFLASRPIYADRIHAAGRQDGNSALYRTIDALLGQ